MNIGVDAGDEWWVRVSCTCGQIPVLCKSKKCVNAECRKNVKPKNLEVPSIPEKETERKTPVSRREE